MKEKSFTKINLTPCRVLFSLLTVLAVVLSSCSDDFDSFSSSAAGRLTFSADTLRLDTTFSNVPTPMRSFWVYNHSGDGLRCANVRLLRGNQSGFRVNVDGVYLGSSAGFQASDIEIRKGDSIRVFVELTSPYNRADSPQSVDDELIFRLESGVEQRVHLNAYSWDAVLLRNVHITTDSTITSQKPLVVYGGLLVDSLATLTIGAGTTLYFHNDAGIDVYGRLLCQGTANSNVVLRGDRIDRMFPYLPYDNVSGQWQGIHLHASSYGNQLLYTDLHSAYHGIRADSSDVEQLKLEMISSIVHNCQGHGIYAVHSNLRLINSQLSNTLGYCANFNGGNIFINSCTFAQFYPFDAFRKAAFFANGNDFPPLSVNCSNSLITGYADDEFFLGGVSDSTAQYLFSHCLIRTPAITDDSLHFENTYFEQPDDTLGTGWRHFSLFDTENLRYDFHLDSLSAAIGKANPSTAFPTDRDGRFRKALPDVGCYEYLHE